MVPLKPPTAGNSTAGDPREARRDVWKRPDDKKPPPAMSPMIFAAKFQSEPVSEALVSDDVVSDHVPADSLR